MDCPNVVTGFNEIKGLCQLRKYITVWLALARLIRGIGEAAYYFQPFCKAKEGANENISESSDDGEWRSGEEYSLECECDVD